MLRRGGIPGDRPDENSDDSDVDISRARLMPPVASLAPVEQQFDLTLAVPPTEVDLGTTFPGPNRTGMAISTVPSISHFLALTQLDLQSGCKRVGQSYSGVKPLLARSLLQAGVSDAATVRTLAS
jgi:hypothetical protein